MSFVLLVNVVVDALEIFGALLSARTVRVVRHAEDTGRDRSYKRIGVGLLTSGLQPNSSQIRSSTASRTRSPAEATQPTLFVLTFEISPFASPETRARFMSGVATLIR
jgi:hypothetical protein